MKKNLELANVIAISCLTTMVVICCLFIAYQKQKLQYADEYIQQLESDFPEHVDTSTGTDAYYNYHLNR